MKIQQFKQHRTHIILFIITFITTTLAGSEWMFGGFILYSPRTLSFDQVIEGLNFSIPFLTILTFHEFGHYLTARYYQIKATLPYYIPVWFGFIASPSIGTIGAFIKIIDKPKTTKQYFDIGIAGPLAGFVIALIVLTYGFQTLPPAEHIFTIHPEYKEYGLDYEQYVYEDKAFILQLGENLLFSFFKEHVASDPTRVPNMYELYHYPWLFAGYLALFFTALNLIPIGQLDGGHVLYGLIGGKNSKKVFRVIFVAFVFFAGFGIVSPKMPIDTLIYAAPLYFLYLYFVFSLVTFDIKKRLLLSIWVFILQFVLAKFIQNPLTTYIYMVFAFVIGRVIGVDHPPSEREVNIGTSRKLLGWGTMLIFVLCFTPSPFNMEINEDARPEETEQDGVQVRSIDRYKADDIDLADHPQYYHEYHHDLPSKHIHNLPFLYQNNQP